MKSPYLLEAKPVYTRHLGVQVLIWTINCMVTLSIADIPTTEASHLRGG